MTNLPIKSALIFAFLITKRHFQAVIVWILLFLIISAIPIVLIPYIKTEYATYANLLASFIRIIMTMMILKISIHICRFQKISKTQVTGIATKFFSYLLSSIIYALIVIIGLLLCIIPGVIWAIKFQFAPILLLDSHVTIKNAFIKSSEITRPFLKELLFFGLFIMLVNLGGLLFFGIGLFVSIPLTIITYVYIYNYIFQKNLTEFLKIQ